MAEGGKGKMPSRKKTEEEKRKASQIALDTLEAVTKLRLQTEAGMSLRSYADGQLVVLVATGTVAAEVRDSFGAKAKAFTPAWEAMEVELAAKAKARAEEEAAAKAVEEAAKAAEEAHYQAAREKYLKEKAERSAAGLEEPDIPF